MLWTPNECKSDDCKMFASFYFFAFLADLSQKSVAKLVTQVSVEFPGGIEASQQQQLTMRLISRRNECLRQQAETEESPREQQSSYVLRPGNIDQSDSRDGRSVRPGSSESHVPVSNQSVSLIATVTSIFVSSSRSSGPCTWWTTAA